MNELIVAINTTSVSPPSSKCYSSGGIHNLRVNDLLSTGVRSVTFQNHLHPHHNQVKTQRFHPLPLLQVLKGTGSLSLCSDQNHHQLNDGPPTCPT